MSRMSMPSNIRQKLDTPENSGTYRKHSPSEVPRNFWPAIPSGRPAERRHRQNPHQGTIDTEESSSPVFRTISLCARKRRLLIRMKPRASSWS